MMKNTYLLPVNFDELAMLQVVLVLNAQEIDDHENKKPSADAKEFLKVAHSLLDKVEVLIDSKTE